MTPAGVTPDHFIDLHIIALHATGAPAPITTIVTHHIADPLPTGTSPEMTVEPGSIIPASNIINQHKDCLPVHKQCLGKTRTEGTNMVTIDIRTLPQNTIVQMSRMVTPRMI